MVKILSPTTATLEKPVPRPVAFHSNFGPSGGHFFSRPVSVETSSLFGPRNCGQSSDAAGWPAKTPAAAKISKARTADVLFMNDNPFCMNSNQGSPLFKPRFTEMSAEKASLRKPLSAILKHFLIFPSLPPKIRRIKCVMTMLTAAHADAAPLALQTLHRTQHLAPAAGSDIAARATRAALSNSAAW